MKTFLVKSQMNVWWLIDGILFVLLIVTMFLIDMNGNYPGVSHCVSSVVTISLLISGLVVNLFLLIKDRQHRLVAGLLFVLFVLAMMPTIL